MCARWARDNLDGLKKADPEIPGALDDRASDNWRPLLAIADCIHGPWPERARQSAVFLSRCRDETGGEGVELLRDIKRLFEERRTDFLGSKEIVERLSDEPLLRWASYRDGQPLTERRLSDLLRAFEIYPTKASDGRRRGYRRPDFEDAFSRYLPSREATAA
jgi:putative DNA primase/helicase